MPRRRRTLGTVPPRDNIMRQSSVADLAVAPGPHIEDRRRVLRATLTQLRVTEHALQAATYDQQLASELTQATNRDFAAHAFLAEVQERLRTAVVGAQRRLSVLLDQEWIVQALFAFAIGGAATYATFRMFSSATQTATVFVREIGQLARVVNNVTKLLLISSAEATRWVAGILGGAMGVSAGMLLSALLPDVSGLLLAAGAAGTYSGFKLLDWSSPNPMRIHDRAERTER